MNKEQEAKLQETIDKLQGKVRPPYYCAKCGSLLVRRGKIKIISYDNVTGQPNSRAILGCPNRTIFSHRTKINLLKRGDEDWARIEYYDG